VEKFAHEWIDPEDTGTYSRGGYLPNHCLFVNYDMIIIEGVPIKMHRNKDKVFEGFKPNTGKRISNQAIRDKIKAFYQEKLYIQANRRKYNNRRIEK